MNWVEIKAMRNREFWSRMQLCSCNQGLGELKGYQALIHMDPQACPRFCKSILVPYAMRAKMDEELDRSVESDVLEPVQCAA